VYRVECHNEGIDDDRRYRPGTDINRADQLIVSNSLTLYYTYYTMLLRQPLRIARTARLSLAQRRLASSLVFLEHKGGKLNDSSLHAVTAAQKVDGEVRRLLCLIV
jgi:hypothetical protein